MRHCWGGSEVGDGRKKGGNRGWRDEDKETLLLAEVDIFSNKLLGDE